MVSVEKYPCFCGAGLKRFESKAKRGFLKCRTETCTLFTPEEKYTCLMECYEMKVGKIFKPNNFPLCICEETASLWVSHSSANPDRPYFRCQDTDPDDKCDYFQWADEGGRKKKKRSLKNVQKKKAAVKKVKRNGPLESSEDEK